jgi:DNA repair exonuclease SbcCD ATPase subunit
MRFRTCLPVVFLTATVTGLVVLVAGAASTPSQKQQQQQQKAAAEALKKATDDAKALESQAADAQKKLLELNTSITAAKQAVVDATKAKKALEDALVDSQPSDSDFGKARDQFRAADKDYQAAQKTVKASPEFLAKLEAARGAEDSERVTAISNLKKEFDAMPEIAGPRTAVQDAKAVYDPLLAKVLAADPKWVEADKDLTDKEKTLADLNRQFAAANAIVNKAKAAKKKADELLLAQQRQMQSQPTNPGKTSAKRP